MIHIKKAFKEDAIQITDIKTRAYNKEINTYLGRDGGPPGYNQVESQLHIIDHFTAYKIMLEDEIIGAFFLIKEKEDQIRFEDFVIDPKFQNKGYGFKTMELIEKKYPHVKQWSLSTPVFSVGNQHLYEKVGYRKVSCHDDEIEYIKKIRD